VRIIKAKIQTKGMHCKSCEMLIKDALEGLHGVIRAEAEHKKGVVLVEFNELEINEETLRKAIANEGYDVL
jgi:copper chaperone CopZ